MTKFCKKCGVTKPVTEFGKKAKNSDGLQYSCKVCTRAAEAKLHAANPEKRKAINARYRAAHPDRRAATFAKWYAANRERSIAAAAKWAAENPDRKAETFAAWYAANSDRVREKNAKWRAANPEKSRSSVAAWQAANPEALRIIDQNRRARKYGGKLSKDLAAKLFKLQRGKCACCGNPLGDDYHLDHIMPLALGGSNTDDNIQLLRSTCNQQKHTKHPVDFMRQRGFLL